MFSRIGAFLTGLVVGGILVFGAQKYHVLRSDDGIHLIPKMAANFSDIFIDIRAFSPNDWGNHPGVAAAVVRAGKSHLLKGAAVDSMFHSAEDLLRSLDS